MLRYHMIYYVRYSTKEIMRARLTYAITNCTEFSYV